MGYESDSTRRYLPSYIEFADNATHTQAVGILLFYLIAMEDKQSLLQTVTKETKRRRKKVDPS